MDLVLSKNQTMKSPLQEKLAVLKQVAMDLDSLGASTRLRIPSQQALSPADFQRIHQETLEHLEQSLLALSYHLDDACRLWWQWVHEQRLSVDHCAGELGGLERLLATVKELQSRRSFGDVDPLMLRLVETKSPQRPAPLLTGAAQLAPEKRPVLDLSRLDSVGVSLAQLASSSPVKAGASGSLSGSASRLISAKPRSPSASVSKVDFSPLKRSVSNLMNHEGAAQQNAAASVNSSVLSLSMKQSMSNLNPDGETVAHTNNQVASASLNSSALNASMKRSLSNLNPVGATVAHTNNQVASASLNSSALNASIKRSLSNLNPDGATVAHTNNQVASASLNSSALNTSMKRSLSNLNPDVVNQMASVSLNSSPLSASMKRVHSSGSLKPGAVPIISASIMNTSQTQLNQSNSSINSLMKPAVSNGGSEPMKNSMSTVAAVFTPSAPGTMIAGVFPAHDSQEEIHPSSDTSQMVSAPPTMVTAIESAVGPSSNRTKRAQSTTANAPEPTQPLPTVKSISAPATVNKPKPALSPAMKPKPVLRPPETNVEREKGSGGLSTIPSLEMDGQMANGSLKSGKGTLSSIKSGDMEGMPVLGSEKSSKIMSTIKSGDIDGQLGLGSEKPVKVMSTIKSMEMELQHMNVPIISMKPATPVLLKKPIDGAPSQGNSRPQMISDSSLKKSGMLSSATPVSASLSDSLLSPLTQALSPMTTTETSAVSAIESPAISEYSTDVSTSAVINMKPSPGSFPRPPSLNSVKPGMSPRPPGVPSPAASIKPPPPPTTLPPPPASLTPGLPRPPPMRPGPPPQLPPPSMKLPPPPVTAAMPKKPTAIPPGLSPVVTKMDAAPVSPVSPRSPVSPSIPSGPRRPSMYKASDPPPVQKKMATVVYAYEAGDPEELTVDPGDQVQILVEGRGDGWLEALNERTGKRGILPESYVEFK